MPQRLFNSVGFWGSLISGLILLATGGGISWITYQNTSRSELINEVTSLRIEVRNLKDEVQDLKTQGRYREGNLNVTITKVDTVVARLADMETNRTRNDSAINSRLERIESLLLEARNRNGSLD